MLHLRVQVMFYTIVEVPETLKIETKMLVISIDAIDIPFPYPSHRGIQIRCLNNKKPDMKQMTTTQKHIKYDCEVHNYWLWGSQLLFTTW